MTPTDHEIEQFIRDIFEENYEQLRMEGAGSLAPATKDAALEQVIYYWRKLRHIAESVTDTEVKLTLPGQETPAGRPFTIHGVVDIVQDEHRTVMYDIKTHTADDVRADIALYEQQLNVYAYIWSQLRGNPLDETAVIATRFPSSLRSAIAGGHPDQIAEELANWTPVVPIPYDEAHVRHTIEEFGAVVDAIEDGEFAPRPPDVLRERVHGTRKTFATLVCVECDARFTCSSFRDYATSARGHVDRHFAQYYSDYGSTVDQDEWLTASLASQPAPQDQE